MPPWVTSREVSSRKIVIFYSVYTNTCSCGIGAYSFLSAGYSVIISSSRIMRAVLEIVLVM